jgi:hypothetical protein
MHSLSNLCFRAAFVFFAVGVGMGFTMSLTQDFALRPVHVHVNLLGWVSFALYAAVYRFFPEAAALRVAKVQVGAALLGLPVMMTGLALVVFGAMKPGLPLLVAGELLTISSAALFVLIGFVATRPESRFVGHRAPAVPAE